MGLKKWEEDNLGGRKMEALHTRLEPCSVDRAWTQACGSPGWEVAAKVVGVHPGVEPLLDQSRKPFIYPVTPVLVISPTVTDSFSS